MFHLRDCVFWSILSTGLTICHQLQADEPILSESDPIPVTRAHFRQRSTDTAHYPAITAFLSAEKELGGVGPGGHGRETDVYLPKEVAEIVASTKPAELFAYLLAYLDHPETYKVYRLRDLIMVKLSEKQPVPIFSWHWSDDVPDDQMRVVGIPYYLSRILYRDFPKSDKKADWLAYFNDLRIFAIVPVS